MALDGRLVSGAPVKHVGGQPGANPGRVGARGQVWVIVSRGQRQTIFACIESVGTAAPPPFRHGLCFVLGCNPVLRKTYPSAG